MTAAAPMPSMARPASVQPMDGPRTGSQSATQRMGLRCATPSPCSSQSPPSAMASPPTKPTRPFMAPPPGSHPLQLSPHELGVVVHQRERDVAGAEPVLADLGHRRHLGGGAGEEDLGEGAELLGGDVPLDHLEAALPGDLHH